MNFLSIIHKHKSGGFHMRMYRLFRHLLDNGDELHVLCAERLPMSHPGLVQHIVRAPFSGRENLLFWLYFMAASGVRAIRISREHHIRRVVTFGPFYTMLCLAPVLMNKIPSITFIRGDNMKQGTGKARNAFFFLADRLGLAVSSKVVFNSAAMLETYSRRHGLPRRKLAVIPNDLEAVPAMSPSERERLRHAQGIGSSEFLIATSGVFSKGKNFSFLIQAMQGLATQGIRLLVIGDEAPSTGERQRLERMAQELGVSSSIIFAGWHDDPRPLLRISDLYVFPSKAEGSPNALLEALGCGLPCFGSGIDEIREVLLHDELLFPLHDVGPLVNKVLDVRWNPGRYEHARALSQERCSAFLFDWGQRVLSAVHSPDGMAGEDT